MGFREFDFSTKDTFPNHGEVMNYLESFATANNLNELIRLDTKVMNVTSNNNGKDWAVTSKNLKTGVTTTQEFSHVVICNGHYSYPRIPTIAGITSFPGRVLHSQAYRNAEDFNNLNVLVIGGSFSALDIVKEVSHSAKHVYSSVRDPSAQEYFTGKTDMSKVTTIPPISSILNSWAYTTNYSFQVDCIIFATGYFYKFPFLEQCPLLNEITNGDQVNELCLGLLHQKYSNLAFIGLPFKTVPFAIAEYQAEFLAAYWDGKFQLDIDSCDDYYSKLRGRDRHTFGYPQDFQYCDRLADFYGGKRLSERKHYLRHVGQSLLKEKCGY